MAAPRAGVVHDEGLRKALPYKAVEVHVTSLLTMSLLLLGHEVRFVNQIKVYIVFFLVMALPTTPSQGFSNLSTVLKVAMCSGTLSWELTGLLTCTSEQQAEV